MKWLLTVILMTSCITQAWAKESVKVELLSAQSSLEKQAAQEIKESGINQLLVELSERAFPFSNTLNVQYGGSEGPLYDPGTHRVHIPYSFYVEARNYFAKNGYEKKYGKSAKDGALDTLLHTLLHEAGHAYIEDKNIPVLGKEEDAVDNFATVILLNYVDSGDDIAISAADMFAFESDDRPDVYDFSEYIDEHSFDLQRYFSTLCLVYGSDPEQYKHLLDEVEQDYLSDRKDFCISQFETINHNWHHYFKQSREI